MKTANNKYLYWLICFSCVLCIPAELLADFDINQVESEVLKEDVVVQFHGGFEFQYMDAENANATFDHYKFLSWMGVPLGKYTFISTEIEYEHAPSYNGNGQSDIKGYGTIKLDSCQLRLMPNDTTNGYVGIFYVPFGIEYQSYPAHKNKLITRPKVMTMGGVVPGTWSDVGIGLNQIVTDIGQLDVFIVNGDAYRGGVSNETKEGGADGYGNDSKTVGARLMLDQMIEGVNLGVSYATGNHDKENQYAAERMSVHFRMDMDKMTGMSFAPVLIAEYVTGIDVRGSKEIVTSGENKGKNKDKNLMGYYFQLSSQVIHSLEAVLRFGSHDTETSQPDHEKNETSVGFVLHLPKYFVKLKAEYQLKREASAKEVSNDVIGMQIVANW